METKWSPGSESNRHARFCRPAYHHSRHRDIFGWETGIRTPIPRVRVSCPTVERSPNNLSNASPGGGLLAISIDHIGVRIPAAVRVGCCLAASIAQFLAAVFTAVHDAVPEEKAALVVYGVHPALAAGGLWSAHVIGNNVAAASEGALWSCDRWHGYTWRLEQPKPRSREVS
jgi:hypothetical protein